MSWYSPDKRVYGYNLPEINLNNLFTYAIPKLKELAKKRYRTFYGVLDEWIYGWAVMNSGSTDPALALFGVIYEMIESEQLT